MQGRIVGNDGNYDQANNLFHGMNRSSAFGNLEKAGDKRISTREATIARKGIKSKSNHFSARNSRNSSSFGTNKYRISSKR